MKFYFFGGCEVQDSIIWLRDNYPEHSYHRIWGTTVNSMLSPPGKIADRVFEWHNKLNKSEQRSLTVERIYKEICTKDFIDECVVDDDTYIVISMLFESSTRYDDGSEHITLIPELQPNCNDRNNIPYFKSLMRYKFPLDIYGKINNKQFFTSVYDSEIAKDYFKNAKLLEKFSEKIYDKFKNKVILLNIPPAKRYYNNTYGFYDDLPKINQYAYMLTSFNNMNIGDYSWNHHNKVLKLLYNWIYKKGFSEKISVINIDDSKIEGDDHHRLGRSPFHFTDRTISYLGSQIAGKINDIRRN
jgi:hypothetical protein